MGASPTGQGRSRFQAKGFLYQQVLEHYGSLVPGGTEAIRGALADAELRRFFEQRFLAGGWYDVLPMVPLNHAAARVQGGDPLRLLRDVARLTAEQDLSGILKWLLKVVSPRQTASALPRMALQLFDFGAAHGELLPEDVYEGHLDGIPASLATWMMIGAEAHCVAAVELAGARAARVWWRPATPGGEHAGVDVVNLHFRLAWE